MLARFFKSALMVTRATISTKVINADPNWAPAVVVKRAESCHYSCGAARSRVETPFRSTTSEVYC